MKRQIIKTATICTLLLFLLPVLGLVTTLLTAKIDDAGSRHYSSHADTHRRWKKLDDDLESRANKLEKKIRELKETPKKRKAENMLKEIRDLLEQQRDIPGKVYRLTVTLGELLDS